MELSYPLVRVPFGRASKNFRLYYKQLTRELAQVTAQIEALEEAGSSQCLDIEIAVEKLARLAELLQSLRQSATRNVLEQHDDLESCVKRARYLQTIQKSNIGEEISSVTHPSDDTKTINDRLVADYLLGQGYLESGRIITDSKDIAYLVDHKLHTERQAVIKDLRECHTDTAIAWCLQNGTRLRRLQSLLELRLRVQDCIELVRARKPLEAVQYARTYFPSLAMQADDQTVRDSAISDVQTALATLAFESPEKCGIAVYETLFAPDRWLTLEKMFSKTFNEVYEMHDPPSLCIALHAGLSTLNTRACHRIRGASTKAVLCQNGSRGKRSRENTEEGGDGAGNREGGNESDEVSFEPSAAIQARSDDSDNNDRVAASCKKRVHPWTESSVPLCPACSEVGSQLCAGLPFAYHPHSRLVCRVTQSVMDEHNPPLVLPNGRVYSKQGIELLTQQRSDGMIRCVDTDEVFSPGDAKPVYIL
uniref:Macrophage erythroblast attacher n=1 Tax=Peronospora matthiolae TaxID=2874970 RepID=A0AAV1UGS7_9STRA